MSTLDPYLVNISGLDVHLRDARHAHQLYSEYSHAFAPKQKFLYHVVFQLHPAVSIGSYNSAKFQKEIGVLVKSADLPSFRATIENKQQYNRKKNAQTRIDYQDVRINLHDDNVGATRSMLEEYYRWYYADGSKELTGMDKAYGPRDKFDSKVPSYGLNVKNGQLVPFFQSIKIYQLARKEWFSYTLINPLLSAWQHDSLDNADGSGIMENVITVAYEAVKYDNGTIGDQGEPANYTSQETHYDNQPSPLGYAVSNITQAYGLSPRLYNINNNTPTGLIAQAANSASVQPSTRNTDNLQPGVLEQIIIPTRQQDVTVTSVASDTVPTNTTQLVQELSTNVSASNSFVAQAINTGAISGLNLTDFNNLSASVKETYTQELVGKISNGDKKLASFAQSSVNATKGTIV